MYSVTDIEKKKQQTQVFAKKEWGVGCAEGKT